VPLLAAMLHADSTAARDLIASGELAGRKVGRRWITSKAAVLRWIDAGGNTDALRKHAAAGDRDAVLGLLNSGRGRVAAP
jgi:hypothetical protein